MTIKRYDVKTYDSCCGYLGHEMMESTDGDFVFYDDVAHLLEKKPEHASGPFMEKIARIAALYEKTCQLTNEKMCYPSVTIGPHPITKRPIASVGHYTSNTRPGEIGTNVSDVTAWDALMTLEQVVADAFSKARQKLLDLLEDND